MNVTGNIKSFMERVLGRHWIIKGILLLVILVVAIFASVNIAYNSRVSKFVTAMRTGEQQVIVCTKNKDDLKGRLYIVQTEKGKTSVLEFYDFSLIESDSITIPRTTIMNPVGFLNFKKTVRVDIPKMESSLVILYLNELGPVEVYVE